MAIRCLFALSLVACSQLPVPTEPMPLTYVGRGHLEKGGVPLDGFTCGDRYAAAVTGDTEAEAEIATCGRYNEYYGAGMIGAIGLSTGALIGGDVGLSRTGVEITLAVAATSFLVGYVSAFVSGHHLNEGVRIYNEHVPTHRPTPLVVE